MNCDQAKENLWEYYDAACSPTQREAVEGHLAGCRNCRASLDEWISLSHKAFRAQNVKAPAFLWTRVLAGIESQEQAQNGAWWLQWHWMSQVATAATLLVSLAAGIEFYQNSLGTPLDNLLHGITSPQQATQLLSNTAPNAEEVTAWLTEGGNASWQGN
jgi:predicted anti-sigma-YlaC factor YlaD